MVKINQTEDEIFIQINLNQIKNSKVYDVIILKKFVKFNQPPIYFEGFLTQEIDEDASYCKLYHKEAKIVLKKAVKGVWPEIFENLSKDEIKQRKQDISKTIEEEYEKKRKNKLQKQEDIKRQAIDAEIKRDTKQREEIESITKKIRETELSKKPDNEIPQRTNKQDNTNVNKDENKFQKFSRDFQQIETRNIRKCGKINFNFSNYNLKVPKRESRQNEMNSSPSSSSSCAMTGTVSNEKK